jgi:signal transduction histidine kinase
MSSRPLRQLVSAIGLFVALTTALSGPVGYGLTSYWNGAERLSLKARLNAARVAKYAYQHGPLWHFHRVRLAELIELPEAKEDRTRQRVITAQEKLVLEEGEPLAAPTFTRSAPVIVSESVVGHIEIEESARALLLNTGLVALFSAILGFLAYFAVRIFPLNVLDRTLGELEAAVRVKADFLATMSHEIRTPLNGILGYTDLLLDNPGLSNEQRRCAERIRGAGAVLLTIVNDILDFSEIEAGQVELEHQPFAPAALIENAASMVKSMAEKKRLALHIEVDGRVPEYLIAIRVACSRCSSTSSTMP